jgi:hypothetical protein
MREIIKSPEFDEFFDSQSDKVQTKLDWAILAISRLDVISTKLAKKLVGTNFYEMRVSMDNEYRVVLLAVGHDNIMKADTVYFLNGFVKKSTKDYKRQLAIAENIVKNMKL